ncbi:hypothetical protein [Bacillus sp. JJ722]|uniref:hypothetical protein n=1 Tax=Bacillus sp. JJ722 TaxID=3122973 RepID=UPI002FFF90C5
MRGRRFVAVGVGIVGAIGLSTIMKDERKRQQLMKMYQNSKSKFSSWIKNNTSEPKDLVQKAGHPDPYDTPDNKMVDEGAVFGVQYYNKVEQKRE